MLNLHLTDFVTIFGVRNPSIDEFYVVKKRESTDFEAPKMWNAFGWGARRKEEDAK